MQTTIDQPPRWFLQAINTPFERGSVEVEGCAISYLQWGDTRKPGVVLIHGGAGFIPHCSGFHPWDTNDEEYLREWYAEPEVI